MAPLGGALRFRYLASAGRAGHNSPPPASCSSYLPNTPLPITHRVLAYARAAHNGGGTFTHPRSPHAPPRLSPGNLACPPFRRRRAALHRHVSFASAPRRNPLPRPSRRHRAALSQPVVGRVGRRTLRRPVRAGRGHAARPGGTRCGAGSRLRAARRRRSVR